MKPDEAIGYAHEVKTYALRKLGEMLKAEKSAGNLREGRPNKTVPNENSFSLADANSDPKVSMLAQQIADFILPTCLI